MSMRDQAKQRIRHMVDRIALPYVEMLRAEIPPANAPGSPVVVEQRVPNGATSDRFHMANHELRTLELERVPKGARRALSVGAQGRWYFDWFERAVGPVDEHIGIEAFEEMPDDLPEYVTWIPDTADHMNGVATSSVDLVFAGQTTEHLWADELSGFLLEAHRVLRPDGTLALDSPNRLVTEHLHWSHGGHTVELSAAEMSELLHLAGFELLSTNGLWCCVVDGRRVELEEGLDNPSVFTRRAASGRHTPDDCFVWWINARRLDRAPDEPRLRARVAELYEAHWNTRVCRGLFPASGANEVALSPGTRGHIGETLPFPLHKGSWTITATLNRGAWSDLEDFRISIVAPGDQLIHDLPAADGRVAGSSLQWHIEQPWLLFALSIKIAIGTVRNEAALALPLDIRFDG